MNLDKIVESKRQDILQQLANYESIVKDYICQRFESEFLDSTFVFKLPVEFQGHMPNTEVLVTIYYETMEFSTDMLYALSDLNSNYNETLLRVTYSDCNDYKYLVTIGELSYLYSYRI